MARLAELGVVASMQGVHATSDGPWTPTRLGSERTRVRAYPFRDLWDAGVLVVNGTDAPVERVDPWASIAGMAVGRTQITFRTLELWSDRPPRVTISDHTKLPSRYYLRFTVDDRPGVLAEITGVLGRHEISIASLIQHEPNQDGGTVPLVIMTHTATEGATQRSVDEIDQLACTHAAGVKMRVLD